MNIFKKLFRKITFSDFRAYVIDNQNAHAEEIKQLKDQIFQSNPVLILHDARIYLPYFYIDHIQKLIYRTGDFYEHITLNHLKAKYPNMKKIVEVGANIGNHMLYYTTQMNAEQVYCFEPNAFNRGVLQKNIEINQLEKKVVVYPVALGSGHGNAVQSEFDIRNTGMNKIEVSDVEKEGSISILPMDHYDFSGIDFIKIDVEGHELEVLKGAKETLKKNKPVIMVEVFEKNMNAVMGFFDDMEYTHKYTLEEHNFIFEHKTSGN